jgi:hypothetical protein
MFKNINYHIKLIVRITIEQARKKGVCEGKNEVTMRKRGLQNITEGKIGLNLLGLYIKS